jgi:hypothetical protein
LVGVVFRVVLSEGGLVGYSFLLVIGVRVGEKRGKIPQNPSLTNIAVWLVKWVMNYVGRCMNAITKKKSF